MQRRQVSACVLFAGLLTACGSSSATTESPTPGPTSGSPSSPTPTLTQTPTAAPTAGTSSAAVAAVPKIGLKTPDCVNGWTEPGSPTDDFFKQALAALQASQGAGTYSVTTVRYFAGPLAAGGTGAIYYLKVAAPFAARVLLVSGAGPGQAAAAPVGTAGWNDGDWKGFRGQTAAVAYPPLPGKWSGPEFDPVAGGLLTPSVAGCLTGT